MEVIYGIFIVIVLVIGLYRGWSYWLYRKSGSILFISPFRNWPIVLLWLAVGVLSISTILTFPWTSGGLKVEELTVWVLLVGFNATAFTQRTKITEGGVLQNGFFWAWSQIESWGWDRQDNSVVRLKAKPKIGLFRRYDIVKLRTKESSKDTLEQLLRKYVTADQ